jgi:hypothetical protein
MAMPQNQLISNYLPTQFASDKVAFELAGDDGRVCTLLLAESPDDSDANPAMIHEEAISVSRAHNHDQVVD